jgi:hypothetical protein
MHEARMIEIEREVDTTIDVIRREKRAIKDHQRAIELANSYLKELQAEYKALEVSDDNA